MNFNFLKVKRACCECNEPISCFSHPVYFFDIINMMQPVCEKCDKYLLYLEEKNEEKFRKRILKEQESFRKKRDKILKLVEK